MAEELDLQVPPLFSRPIELVAGLSETQFKGVSASLDSLAPSEPRQEVIAALRAALGEDLGGEAAILLDFLTQTRGVVSRTGLNVDSVASAIARAVRSDGTALKDRIEDLLSRSYVAIREKVVGLQREPEPRLDRSRCITDLRPVFALEGGTDDVLGFIVISTLVLQLDGDEQDRVVSIRADRKQLMALRDVLDRALKKHETLGRTLDRAKLVNLTQGED